MKFMNIAIFILVGSFFSSPSWAISKRDMVMQAEFTRYMFATSYAPTEWKERYADWNLDREINAIKQKLQERETVSLNEYHRLLLNFIQSAKDYHVGISFEKTEKASLPFVVKSAEGRYFLASIDRKKLGKESFPFKEGDELVSFDGKPTAEVIAAIKQERLADNVPTTDLAIAELQLTSRSASRGFTVPRGPITVSIKRQGEEKTVNHQLVWEYTPEITRLPDGLGSSKNDTNLFGAFGSSFNLPEQEPSLGEKILRNAQMVPANLPKTSDEEDVYEIGAKNSYLPKLGKVIWENDKDKLFQAYIFKSDAGKLIGFVRIASYMPPGGDADKAIEEMIEILKHFQEVTDALVIDEQNNPGGSVFYLYTLASLLSDQPLLAPRHRFILNQSDVSEAHDTLEKLKQVNNDEEAQKALKMKTLSGFPVTYQTAAFLKDYAQFVIDQWAAGKTLTDYYYFWGADQLNPSAKVQYNKPILILVDELCFSGGDFFPTILQDNKRAVIMGRRTAGAGGAVKTIAYPNLMGVSRFSVTWTLAERVDGNPIENLGVTPDVPYTITVNDRQKKYADYKKAINEQLEKMLN